MAKKIIEIAPVAAEPVPVASPDISKAIVGVDIGYRATKAVMPGASPVIFHSVAAPARTMGFQAEKSKEEHPGDRLTEDDDSEWFIGDLAVEQYRNPDSLLKLRGRIGEGDSAGNLFRLRMVKAALGKLFGACDGRVVHIRLATGLPVDHMNWSGQLKNALIGQHRIKTDRADFIANITEVSVMPQPYAVIYSQMLTADGQINKAHTAKFTGVIDAGGYTTDAALDHEGTYIDSASGSVEMGISSAQEEIANLLLRNHEQKPSYEALERCLRTGFYRVRGEDVDYQDQVYQALEPLRSSTMAMMGNKWQVGAEIDAIYVAGGGASVVYDVIKAAYSQAKLVDNPQMAIALGYLNYALFVERNG